MQQYLSIDYLIIYAFFIATLWLGVRAGRGVKDVREYVVANKSFGVGALVLTYLATNLAGASVFDGIIDTFSDGIIAFISVLGFVIAFLIRAFLLPQRQQIFRNA